MIEEAGDSTIDIEVSAGAVVQALGAQEFTAGAGWTWAIGSNGQSNDVDEATFGTYPPISPAFVFELYAAAGLFLGGSPAGSTPGFVYNEGDPALAQFVYGLNVSWPDILAPEWTADLGFWTACAGLLVATAPAIDTETIYRTWENSDGSTPQGTVTFVRKGQVSGSPQATSVGTRPIKTPLLSGQILQQLVPNVNPDLTPDGTCYWSPRRSSVRRPRNTRSPSRPVARSTCGPSASRVRRGG